jgi:D-alanyl-lipoteichoic acid acyltransferase DltB (MBOAT superfamily)
MLFNSYAFIFAFLPLAVLGYAAVNRLGSRRFSLGWLILCSMVFYGIWNPLNIALILPSIAVNYALALAIRAQLGKGEAGERVAGLLATLGVVLNLCFLGYFKYKNFFLGTVNDVAGTHFLLTEVILPLGISFITFQKIAFLVDVRAGAVREFDLFDFLTFVFFFPQLIAGPIVHYREMMPQFARIDSRLQADNLAVGATLFAFGLFKKVVLADGIAPSVHGAFAAAAQGEAVSFFPAWMAALAYTLQIYFDFSGYSDMAIGLARLFGIRLPANFNSPLKASSIIEFWSRWHITLTRFLTAYVYTPMVMSLTRKRMAAKKPVIGRKRPTLGAFAVLLCWPTVFTMFLSGFWHGAGYTYLVWGILHGVYLSVNHGWRQWRPKWDKSAYERIMKPLGFVLTFLCVVVAMVLFRAPSMTSALHMLHGMAGLDGITVPMALLNHGGAPARVLGWLGIGGDAGSGAAFANACLWIAPLLFIALALPNSLELLGRFGPALYFDAPPAAAASSRWRAAAGGVQVAWNARWAVLSAALFVFGALGLSRPSEFLYWQF